jgi:hypothetical protein
MYSYKITTGEVRLVPTVHDLTATYTARVPEPEARAHRIAAEAGCWLAFATARTAPRALTPAALTTKALDAACFSVAVGAEGFALPSKLTGVKAHQRALWQIVRDGYRVFDKLETDMATTEGVHVSYGDTLLGEVQPKHVGWVRPLVPFGLTVHLARITGSEREGRTLGVNVVFGHVAPAIAALTEAVGTSGDGASGVASTFFPAPALPMHPGSGDSASGRLRLVLPVGNDAPGPADVVLYREVGGAARATVAHTPVHSPTGIDWGRLGAGPTDLSLAILTAVAGSDVAARHSAAFAAEVVAHVPYAGGVLRAARVRDWLARQQA